MAKLSTDELISAFKELTLIELSEFVKAFEETFEVTAAAPVAAAAPAAAGGGAAAEEISKLADLESREVLLAKTAGVLKATLFQAAYLFTAPAAQAVRTVEALREKQASAETAA